MRDGRGRALAVAVLLAVLTGCGGDATGETQASTPSATSAPTASTAASPFPYSRNRWRSTPAPTGSPAPRASAADYTVTFPEGWTVPARRPSSASTRTRMRSSASIAVVRRRDLCRCVRGQRLGGSVEVGPGVDDLATALLEQPGPKASGPVETTLGGYPATRIDLTVPEGFDLEDLQLARMRPADLATALRGQVLRALRRRHRERRTSSTSTVSARCS